MRRATSDAASDGDGDGDDDEDDEGMCILAPSEACMSPGKASRRGPAAAAVETEEEDDDDLLLVVCCDSLPAPPLMTLTALLLGLL